MKLPAPFPNNTQTAPTSGKLPVAVSAIARSSFPSPFKSTTAVRKGRNPTSRVFRGVNAPEPFPSSIATFPEVARLGTIKSTIPSLLTSPAEID